MSRATQPLDAVDPSVCVVFADMVGYSALSSTQEVETHRMWMDFRRTCLDPEAERFGARIVRMLGDGCLLTFKDATAALDWMLAVRERIVGDRVGRGTRWPNLALRFGAHCCGVIEEHGDVYGSGVNLSKRIQERASGDGVLVSQAFLDGLDGPPVAFRYLGELQYRNIAQSLATHEAVFTERTSPIREATDDLPSIAVMPFENATGDPGLDWFAEGLIDDIIQSLASLKELRVISRNSTVPLAERTRDPTEIARILKVRYVLQGTLRGNATTGRLDVTFEDARAGETLFAQKSGFSHSELFEVQDSLVRQIVGRVTPQVRSAELEKALRKPPANFTAYQSTLRALDLMKRMERDEFVQARRYLDKAIELDDQFCLPKAWLARWYCVLVGQHWAEDRAAAIEDAEQVARAAVALDRENPLALAAYGHVRSYLKRDYETAMVYYDRSRQLSPSHSLTWILSSATLSYLGKGEEAVEHAKVGLQLSPNDQDLHQYYDFATVAFFVNGQEDESLSFAEMSHAEMPGYVSNLKNLAALHAHKGNLDKAREHARSILKIDPNFSLSRYKTICPYSAASRRDWFIQSLRIAGIPD